VAKKHLMAIVVPIYEEDETVSTTIRPR